MFTVGISASARGSASLRPGPPIETAGHSQSCRSARPANRSLAGDDASTHPFRSTFFPPGRSTISPSCKSFKRPFHNVRRTPLQTTMQGHPDPRNRDSTLQARPVKRVSQPPGIKAFFSGSGSTNEHSGSAGTGGGGGGRGGFGGSGGGSWRHTGGSGGFGEAPGALWSSVAVSMALRSHAVAGGGGSLTSAAALPRAAAAAWVIVQVCERQNFQDIEL